MNSYFLLINKPVGPTSRDICNQLQKKLNTKKIGHSGTLDPFASGLLIIGVGKSTKLFNYLDSDVKTYTGEFTFGYVTDTLDITGKELNRVDESELSKIDFTKIQNVINKNLIGKISQKVPNYSAAKINGKRRYELARENIEMPDKFVDREVFEFNVEKKSEYRYSFEVKVSTGTYIRQLINDLAESYSTIATLETLTRTKIGNINLENSQSVEDDLSLIRVDELIKEIPSYDLDEYYDDLNFGRFVSIDSINEDLLFAKNKNEIFSLLEKVEEKYKIKFKI